MDRGARWAAVHVLNLDAIKFLFCFWFCFSQYMLKVQVLSWVIEVQTFLFLNKVWSWLLKCLRITLWTYCFTFEPLLSKLTYIHCMTLHLNFKLNLESPTVSISETIRKIGEHEQNLNDIIFLCTCLAWKIPWREEPGGLQSMGSLRVGHYWATSLSLFTFMHWRRKWQPTPVFLPGESQGPGSLVGCHLWGRTVSDTTEVT